MADSRSPVDHSAMSERGLHRIEDDLADTWLEDWAGAGVAEIEDFLAKHEAFLAFLDIKEPYRLRRGPPRPPAADLTRRGRGSARASPWASLRRRSPSA